MNWHKRSTHVATVSSLGSRLALIQWCVIWSNNAGGLCCSVAGFGLWIWLWLVFGDYISDGGGGGGFDVWRTEPVRARGETNDVNLWCGYGPSLSILLAKLRTIGLSLRRRCTIFGSVRLSVGAKKTIITRIIDGCCVRYVSFGSLK